MANSRLFDMSTFKSAFMAINSRGLTTVKLGAVILALVLVPVMFPGIFIPQAIIAGTPAALAVSDDVFNNLKFENRAAFEAQVRVLIASYEKKLAVVPGDSELARVLTSRIKTAQAILDSATDDMFLDRMVGRASRVPAVKPYFGYSDYGHVHHCCECKAECQKECACHCGCHHTHKYTRTRAANLGLWAVKAEKEAYDQDVQKCIAAGTPAVSEDANASRVAKIDETVRAAIEANRYVPEIKAAPEKELKAEKTRKHGKRHKKFRKARKKAQAPARAK